MSTSVVLSKSERHAVSLPFFTSDTHFFHGKMAKARHFLYVEEMNRHLVEKINTTAEGGTLYHLGDLSFAGFEKTQAVVGALRVKLAIVPGNHDQLKLLERLSTELGPVEVKPPLVDLKVGTHSKFSPGETIVHRLALCHFPLQVWNRSHYGAYHLHGHSHGSLRTEGGGRRLDVGVDSAYTRFMGFRPFTFDEVQTYMNAISIAKHDRHGEDHEY
jgi:calcineurin-like phosphoesterase family protein